VRNLLARGEGRHRQVAQVFRVARPDVGQEIDRPGHVVKAHHLGQVQRVLAKGLDVRLVVPLQPHRDHRLQALGLTVNYPGLPDHPDHELFSRLHCPDYGYGGLLIGPPGNQFEKTPHPRRGCGVDPSPVKRLVPIQLTIWRYSSCQAFKIRNAIDRSTKRRSESGRDHTGRLQSRSLTIAFFREILAVQVLRRIVVVNVLDRAHDIVADGHCTVDVFGRDLRPIDRFDPVIELLVDRK
jgi:hypothetical protein